MAKARPDKRPTDIAHVPALGFLELSSISRGLFLTDAVLKKAPVKIVVSQPISSGKHVILYMGDVASVDESHREALDLADGTVLKEVLIPGVHEKLVPFLENLASSVQAPIMPSDTVGIVESMSLTGAILAADKALKTADVAISRMRLGQGIGGKAYFVLSGEQHDVEASLEAAEDCLRDLESLCRVDCIPRPDRLAVAHF